jgi:nucleotide-binding universal stress UspA family protein
MTRSDSLIVVGVDRAAAGAAGAAIALGAWEAARRGTGLHLVSGYPTPPAGQPAPGIDWTATHAREVLERIVARTAAAHPWLTVTGAVDGGSLAAALVAASRTAALVIVGAEARVHYGGLLAGLTSIQVAAHAHTPVIIVPTRDARPRPAVTGRVVIGVDGSPGSADAAAFAFDEAQVRGVALHAMYVSPIARPGLPVSARRDERDRIGADDRMLHDATAGWQDKYPDIPVTHQVVAVDNPVRALHDATGDGDLIVVGARGLGGFPTLALGSVSDGIVRYARCQVAIARPSGSR